MKYMLLMYANEAEAPNYTPEQLQAATQVWETLRHEAEAAGVLVTSNGLAPTRAATTVRVREGQTLFTDGPFAETHEQLGGYLLIDCKDLDEALCWAARVPTAHYGAVEVRPLWSQE